MNAAGASDRRPLHRAVGAGNKDVIHYLLQQGAVVDLPDKSGRTPLHWAAMTGDGDVTALPLDLGANAFTINKSGKSTLHLAADSGKAEAAEAIEAATAKEWGRQLVRGPRPATEDAM